MKELQLPRRCFIKAAVMKLPYFDWKDYIQLLKSNVSIVAEACYGGLLSSMLGLPFCSPFVNLRVGIEPEDYYSLLENLREYMNKAPSLQPKEKYRNTNFVGWEGRIEFPLLWYDDVLLHGFHYENTAQFLEIFEKRRKRFNPNKYVVFKVLYDEEDVKRFQSLPHKVKWGIYYKPTDYDNIITVPFSDICNPYAYAYGTYVFQYFKSHQIFENLNVFKLLGN